MSQNGQTHFKNLAAFAARFLKCVWPFWDIMHWRVTIYKSEYSESLIQLYHLINHTGQEVPITRST